METDRPVTAKPAQGGYSTLRWAAFFLLVSFATFGCQSRWQYDWGSYQNSVWLTYAPADGKGEDVGKQIDVLDKEIQRAVKKTRLDEPSRVPPGKYAHLGYLHALRGDATNARLYLEAEKRTYPESNRFIDTLLARMP